MIVLDRTAVVKGFAQILLTLMNAIVQRVSLVGTVKQVSIVIWIWLHSPIVYRISLKEHSSSHNFSL